MSENDLVIRMGSETESPAMLAKRSKSLMKSS